MAENAEKGEQPPPSYESQPMVNENSPPSYDSLFGEIKAAKQESSSFFGFLGKALGIFFASVGFLVLLAIFMAIPIACIVIGVEYKNDCPIQKYIPIYLIVAGSFGVFRNLISLCSRGTKKRKKDCGEEVEDDSAGKKGCEGIIDLFLFAWFICGNVWIYKNYQPNYTDNTRPDYCHKTLYLFAFWTTTATYILAATACCCFCFCAGAVAAFSG